MRKEDSLFEDLIRANCIGWIIGSSSDSRQILMGTFAIKKICLTVCYSGDNCLMGLTFFGIYIKHFDEVVVSVLSLIYILKKTIYFCLFFLWVEACKSDIDQGLNVTN